MIDITIIIPTRNRPVYLRRAIESALVQASIDALEILVVDDGSVPPATVPRTRTIRLVRLDPGRGGAAARNVGLAEAAGRWITFLDDDDELLPGMVDACLQAVTASDLPPPRAAVTALEVVDSEGRIVDLRSPPTMPRGCHWNLEPLPPGRSFLVKQSLFIERETLVALGGFDESFNSRVHTELFLRLNPGCSIIGVERPYYRHYLHGEPSVTADLTLHKESFRRLIRKHRTILRQHPKGFANMALDQVGRYRLTPEGIFWLIVATRIDPICSARRVITALARRLGRLWSSQFWRRLNSS